MDDAQVALTATDEGHLRRAIELARLARDSGDPPFGSLLVDADGRVLAEDHNTTVTERDITAHPELKLARWAARELSPADTRSTTMYTSCRPCGMCANAIARANLGRVVYGLDPAQLAALKPAEMAPLDSAEVVYHGPALVEEASAAVRGYYG